MGCIVVGWDSERTAGGALAWAAAQAKLTDARLVLVHVAVPLGLGGAVEVAVPLLPSADEITAIEQSMRRAAEPFEVPSDVEVVVEPFVAKALIEVARRREASLLCVGHGRTPLAHLLLGSVAAQVVRQSPIPVVVVRT